MGTRERPRPTARQALWLGGLLLLLAGIVGMHGLDGHGVVGMDTATHAMVSGPGADSVDLGHDVMGGAVHEVASPMVVMVASAAADGHFGMDGGMAGLCVAVIGVALTVLLRMLGSAPALALYRLVAYPVRAPEPHGRDRDPPSLICLSTQRC